MRWGEGLLHEFSHENAKCTVYYGGGGRGADIKPTVAMIYNLVGHWRATDWRGDIEAVDSGSGRRTSLSTLPSNFHSNLLGLLYFDFVFLKNSRLNTPL